MAKIKLELDKRSVVNGRSQVRVRLTNKNTSVYIPTGAYVERDVFTGNLYRSSEGKGVYYSECNELVSGIVRKYEAMIFDLTREGKIKDMTAMEIRDYVDGKRKRSVSQSVTFIEFFAIYAEDRQSEKTRKDLAYALRVIKEYCAYAHIHALAFDMIDYSFLSSLDRWMRKNRGGEYAIYKIMSYIRSVYNEGAKRKLADRNNYPFDDYKIRRPEPSDEIHTLSLNAMRKLIAMDFAGHPACYSLNLTKAALLASFYLCGANLLDVFNIEKPTDGYAVFIRHKLTGKTKRPVRIYVDSELQELVSRYAGEKYMFNFKERFASFGTFQSKVDHKSKVISEMIGEKVNLATMRRTWVTYAARLEVEDRVIEKSIGHKDKTVTGIHYEEYDWSRTARANRKVIDYIKGATE